jgi:hypothetical protein
MTTDNYTLTFEPNPMNKKTMNASSASGNSTNKKIAKTMKSLSLRPNRSVKRNNSLKAAFNKTK